MPRRAGGRDRQFGRRRPGARGGRTGLRAGELHSERAPARAPRPLPRDARAIPARPPRGRERSRGREALERRVERGDRTWSRWRRRRAHAAPARDGRAVGGAALAGRLEGRKPVAMSADVGSESVGLVERGDSPSGDCLAGGLRAMYVPAEHGLPLTTLLDPCPAGMLPFPLSAPRHLYFYRARTAIYHAFRSLGFERGDTVLMPDYHNSNEVAAVRASGATVRFYRIGRNLEPDLEELGKLVRSTNARALFAIHYFGWAQPVKELTALCDRHDMILFEDCAMSLLSETLGQPLGSFGQFATYCLYKTLPVPNGGVLVQNQPGPSWLDGLQLEPCDLMTLGGRTLELLLESLRGRAVIAGESAFAVKRTIGALLRLLRIDRVPFGDIGFDRDRADVAISPLSL